MPQTPSNWAAWQAAPQTTLEVKPAPFTPAGPNELVIQNSALGINPIDWIKQTLGDKILGHVKYPTVLGEDVAGTVIEVGEEVTRFKVGDRVLAIGSTLLSNNPAEAGFQLYTVARERLTTLLPEHVTFEQAAALPLPILTASQGLFGILGLDQPTVPARPATNANVTRTVIIAGGASAVGGTAVQFATSAGYEVVSTASPKNFDRVKSLGATHVFDYNSTSLVDKLSVAVRGKQLCGALAIADGTADILANVLSRHEGPGPTSKRIARAEGKHNVKDGSDVEVVFIVNDISTESPARSIFEKFLPKALAARQFMPAPEPQVVGKGLDQIQPALDILKQGVSAKKIIVTL
jgi:NADPH:quinone reductase-like Zn-dependent oxidoreductase